MSRRARSRTPQRTARDDQPSTSGYRSRSQAHRIKTDSELAAIAEQEERRRRGDLTTLIQDQQRADEADREQPPYPPRVAEQIHASQFRERYYSGGEERTHAGAQGQGESSAQQPRIHELPTRSFDFYRHAPSGEKRAGYRYQQPNLRRPADTSGANEHLEYIRITAPNLAQSDLAQQFLGMTVGEPDVEGDVTWQHFKDVEPVNWDKHFMAKRRRSRKRGIKGGIDEETRTRRPFYKHRHQTLYSPKEHSTYFKDQLYDYDFFLEEEEEDDSGED